MTRDNFYDYFAHSAGLHARKPAVEIQRASGVESLTFGEMRALSDNAACWLASLGVRQGDRCAILAGNDAAWCAAYLGILRLGAVAVPLDTTYKPKQVATVVQDSGARILLTTVRHLETARSGLASLAGETKLLLLHEACEGLAGLADVHREDAAGELPPCPAVRTDPAVILYTSGTTSDPKGVVLTHNNLVVELESIQAAVQIDDRDRILGILPLFHALAQVANLLLPLGVGATVVYLETLNTTELLRALSERNITAFCCVPQFFYLIHQRIKKQLAESGWLARKGFRSLLRFNGALRDSAGLNMGSVLFSRVHKIIGRRMRFLVTGGSRFEGSIGRDFYCMGFNILQAYGLTECTGGATLTPLKDGWSDSVGTPLQGVEVRIVPDEEVSRQDSKMGEVVLRGANVMQGYYNRPDANAEVFRDGWFHTGDLGYVDKRGYLHITGRKKEMIVLSSGKNIYPEEIESHYVQSPYIKELCVMGAARPGEPLAERLHAIIVPDFEYMRECQIVNTREIIRFDIENFSVQLPSNKRILSYDIWQEDLPRTTTRKLQRFAIEAMFRERSQTAGAAPEESTRKATPEEEAWASRPDVERVLASIAAASKGDGRVTPDANIELDLGLDSMERVELLAQLESEFDARVPEDLASGIYTVRELVEALLASSGVTAGEDRKADTWKQILSAADGDDPVLAGIVKPRPIATMFLFLLLKLIYAGARLFFRFRVRGREHLPAEGAFLLCPNHQSFIDGFLLASALPYSVMRRIFFVGASEFFETPVMRWLSKLSNIVPVDPDAKLVRAMQAGAYGLRHNKVLILFPEGERCIDGQVKKFKKGAPILSMNLGVPIVPVAFEGLFDVWPRGRSFQGFRRVRMEIGKPLPPSEKLSPAATQTEAEARYDQAASRLRDVVHAMWSALHQPTTNT